MANIHPRATKKSLLNIAKETAHPSVGRSLSAGHHRLILPLYRLRLNAPPQDRLHRSNVTMLARAKPNIPHREPLRTIHTVAISCVPPVNGLQSRLARLASLYPIHPLQTVLGGRQTPKTRAKRNSSKDHCSHYGKSARRSFSNGALFLALLCKPPLERIT